jgi:hypothetical protein
MVNFTENPPFRLLAGSQEPKMSAASLFPSRSAEWWGG